jgi:hypothetical protein
VTGLDEARRGSTGAARSAARPVLHYPTVTNAGPATRAGTPPDRETAADQRGRRRLLALAAVLLVGLALRLPTFTRQVLSDDESIYTVIADAMRRGDVLYRDVVDHKPPAIYDVYLASATLLGPYNTQGAHALAVVAVLLCGVALAWGARRLWPDPRAAWLSALLWVVFSTTMADFDALAANCELFLLPFQALAFLWLVRGLGTAAARPLATWFGVGVLVGISVVFKFQGATFLAVMAAAWGVELAARRLTGRRALAAVLASGVGCLVVPGGYLLRTWLDGGLGAMWFWLRFNGSYVAAGPGGLEALRLAVVRTVLLGGIGAFLPYAFGLAGAWATLRAWTRRPAADGPSRVEPASVARLLALVWLASSAIAVAAGFRFFGHYFLLVLPPLCLLAAGPILAAWDRRPRLRPALALLVVVPALVALAMSSVLRASVVGRLDPKPPYATVAARLRALSDPRDRVFVWGYSTQIYVYAGLPLGARFSFCDYLTGVSQGTRTVGGRADPTPNVVWSAWDMLFDDLDRRQPRWFVDAAAAGWDAYGPFQVARYPRLAAYVAAHYRERERVAGVVVYERRTP